MVSSASPVLSSAQLATLAAHGEERTAPVGETLFAVGDRRYPFIAIVEGEAAILDAAGQEIVRHGASGFLGEMNLLSGQTVYLSDRHAGHALHRGQPRRPATVAVRGRAAGRPAADHLHAPPRGAPAARRRRPGGHRPALVGAHARDRRVRKRSRLPYSWRDPEHSDDPEAQALIDELGPDALPLVRLPGGPALRNPTSGEVSRALGIGLELDAREEVDLVAVSYTHLTLPTICSV